MSANYSFADFEPRWQRVWHERKCFRAANPGEPGCEKPKFYVLDFFPYPSGAGLHVGHPLGYIASDIVARYKRARGFNVLHPMGWDAFGLPAEQYAIETGVHPRETTRKNIETYTRQLRQIGLGYDWDRELATSDERYYRWTQWIFLQIYNAWYDPEYHWTDSAGREIIGAARPIEKLPIPADVRAGGPEAVEDFRSEHRLAYLSEVPVNWCPALGTVLSNEEVTNDGRSERGNHPVFRRPMKQWMLRITEYAERLLKDLDPLDWPEPIKLMQRNWIGRSEGAYVDFKLETAHGDDIIRVFTTRPDTLFGSTYLVLAPEHRLVTVICTPEQRGAVAHYVKEAAQKSDLARTSETKIKTGVFTGAFAINPVNQQRIPIWVADYVLGAYGTGSIMAVPGSDKRDLEFAETFGLPVVKVVEPPTGHDWRGYDHDGVSVNSPPADTPRFAGQCDLNGLATADAKRRIITWLEGHELGEGTRQYKLRDWLFSRQRYWGEPFPILYHPDGRAESIPDAELPVRLPDLADFRPHASEDPNAEPQTPLSRAGDWPIVRRNGEVLRRELNTMPQWAGSCWYYLRFLDPRNSDAMVDRRTERYWMGGPAPGGSPRVGGVDLYMGGAEHAVLHLLYARFWHKVLYDLGHVSTPEPFHKLFNQGMIQGYAYKNRRGVYVSLEEIERRDDGVFHKQTGEPLTESVEKMSKSLRNVINPDSIIHEYGADTLRLYEMYMGPLEASKPWNTRDIIGVHRFLQRVWKMVVVPGDEAASSGRRADDAGGETGASAAGPDTHAGRDAGAAPGGRDGSATGGRDSASASAAPDDAWRISPRIVSQRNPDLERLLHKAIRKVESDIERFAFNTAIAQLIVFVNEANKAESIGRDQVERFLQLLAPFAPHICEELWHRLGHGSLMAHVAWPAYDEALTRDETVEIAVQVKGKLRARVHVPTDASDEQMIAAALAVEAVAKELAGKPPSKSIVVKGRLVNLIP